MLGKTNKAQHVNPDRPPVRTMETSVISKDMRITGDCMSSGRLNVQGNISGDVTVQSLELATSGRVKGDVTADETSGPGHPFLINGTVEGTVRAPRVEIGGQGIVKGGVEADDVVVHGRVQGGIVARVRLALEAAAAVEGDVRARRLALKEGGEVNGTILMGARAMKELGLEDRKEPGTSATAARESDKPPAATGVREA